MARHLRRGCWRGTWSLILWHLLPLNRAEKLWVEKCPLFLWFILSCLVCSHPALISRGFVPSSCRVVSISIRYKTIPSLTSPICLRFIWFHLTLTVIIFLPFSEEKSKQNNLGAHTGREEGLRRILKHWNNQGEGSKLMSGEQRDYSCDLLSGHICIEYFPNSSQLWWPSPWSLLKHQQCSPRTSMAQMVGRRSL